MMQFQENARTDGMMERKMEGRADKHYFIVLFQLPTRDQL